MNYVLEGEAKEYIIQDEFFTLICKDTFVAHNIAKLKISCDDGELSFHDFPVCEPKSNVLQLTQIRMLEKQSGSYIIAPEFCLGRRSEGIYHTRRILHTCLQGHVCCTRYRKIENFL